MGPQQPRLAGSPQSSKAASRDREETRAHSVGVSHCSFLFHLRALGTLCSINRPRRPASLWESRNSGPSGPAFLLGPHQKVLALGLVPQVQRGYVIAKKEAPGLTSLLRTLSSWFCGWRGKSFYVLSSTTRKCIGFQCFHYDFLVLFIETTYKYVPNGHHQRFTPSSGIKLEDFSDVVLDNFSCILQGRDREEGRLRRRGC